VTEAPESTFVDEVEFVVPERPEMVRSPGDALHVVVAVSVTIVAVLAILFSNLGVQVWDASIVVFLAGIETRPIDRLGLAVVQISALALPVAAFAMLWWRDGLVRPLLAVFAGVIGASTVWILEQVIERPTPTVYLDALNSDLWVGPAGFPNATYIAGLAAALTVAGPSLSRQWRRASWLLVWAMVLFRLWSFTALLFDSVVALSLGWMVGAAVLYVFGAPNRTPSPLMVAEAIERAGLAPRRVEAAAVDARASTPYFVEDSVGDRYFVKVISRDNRSADLLFRLYRWVRTKNVGDERAFSSLRRGAEHEALVAYHATSAGVSTPRIRAIGDVAEGAMLLAYDEVRLRTLDQLDADELANDHLVDVWAQIMLLHGSRCAHRDLRLANLAIDEHANVVVIDFGFSELAASDDLLSADVAELVLSSATMVGAERAVDSAVSSLGEDAVVDAAQWMQPLAVSGATRAALKERDGLLEEVHREVERHGDLEQIVLTPIERVRPRTIAALGALGVAFYLLIPQLAKVDFGTVSRANPGWVVAGIVFTTGKYVGNALAVHGSVPRRLPFGGPFVAELGSTFANRVTPAQVGGLAVNVRYLVTSGVSREIAVAGIAVVALVSAVVHLAALVVFAVWTGRADLIGVDMLSGGAVLVGLVAVLTLAGILVRAPRVREVWDERLRPAILESAAGLAKVSASPARMLLVFGGTLLAVLAYIGALYASLEAFGAGLPFATVAVVYLAGSAIGGLAPIPGGIGAIEAALIAALTAFGLDASIAVPGVFLFRIISFWIPIVPGWFAMVYLDRTGSV
jgi:uncharacterized protein (TIRG00374 family)